MKIKNIVFDLGGVLFDLQIEKGAKAMSEALNTSFEPFFNEHREWFDEYETGILHTEEFLWRIQHVTQVPDPTVLVKAWNAMLLGWDVSKFSILDILKQRYRLFLLSNTNELHMQWFMADLKLEHGVENMEGRFFEKAYFSHQIGYRKPDAKAFQYVLQDAGILAEETLYIDDLEANVAAAKSVGLVAIHHLHNTGLDYLLDEGKIQQYNGAESYMD